MSGIASTKYKEFPKPYTAYSSVDVTVSGNSSNYDIAANTTLFSKISNAQEVLFRVYDNDISIKLNAATNDPISVEAGAWFTLQNLLVNNIYVTTASGSALVKIMSLGWS